VACVSIDAETQKQRVMARQTMDEKTFQQILDRQWPNADKAAKSDYVIHTDSLDHAKQQVAEIVKTIRNKINA
jgi:dephospho-CoA kinase